MRPDVRRATSRRRQWPPRSWAPNAPSSPTYTQASSPAGADDRSPRQHEPRQNARSRDSSTVSATTHSGRNERRRAAARVVKRRNPPTLWIRGAERIHHSHRYARAAGATSRPPTSSSRTSSAAVDYLGTRALVDRERIGVIGMCGSGALSLSATQVARRIKAVAPVVMYDHHRLYAEGFENSLTEAQRIASHRR